MVKTCSVPAGVKLSARVVTISRNGVEQNRTERSGTEQNYGLKYGTELV